jgi:hypothetical protein
MQNAGELDSENDRAIGFWIANRWLTKGEPGMAALGPR